MIIVYIVLFLFVGSLLYKFAEFQVEKHIWNKGRCPKCGKRWRYYMTDPKNGRHYTCDKCGAGAIIYSNADKSNK